MEIERLQTSVNRLRARLGTGEEADVDGIAPDTKMKSIISRYCIITSWVHAWSGSFCLCDSFQSRLSAL